MTAEMLKTLSLVSYIVGGIILLVAIALFFILKIPEVFGDVTGSTEKKAIKSIRQHNEEYSDKLYNINAKPIARAGITDKIPTSSVVQANGGNNATISQMQNNQPMMSPETTLIGDYANETTILNQPFSDETTILYEQSVSNETTILNHYELSGQTAKLSQSSGYQILTEIAFTQSEEIIE